MTRLPLLRCAALIGIMALAGCHPADNAASPPKGTDSTGVATESAGDVGALRAATAKFAAVAKETSAESPIAANYLAALGKGDSAALMAFPDLRSHADAGLAEAMDMAAAQALPRSPRMVLKLSDHGIPLKTLCTSPFIEPEPDVEKAYFTKVEAALTNLGRDPEMAENAKACIELIRPLEVQANDSGG